MEHVVFFPGPDGAPAFRRTGSLEEAVHLVEHLRNVESVAEVSVHSLSEVPLSFKAYFKVEMPGGQPEIPVQAAPVAEMVEVAAPAEPMVEAPVEAVVDSVVEPVAEAVVEPVVDEVPSPVDPMLEPVGVAPAEDIVPAPAEEPSMNGRRTLGFFSH